MPIDFIARKLQTFQNETKICGKISRDFVDESPLERTKKEVLAQIAASESYRVGILKTVSTFCKFFIVRTKKLKLNLILFYSAIMFPHS